MVRIRLDSFHFMGQGNNGRNFFDGLRSLAMLYPLVRAAAKYNVAVRGATRIDASPRREKRGPAEFVVAMIDAVARSVP